jgi:cell division protein FtsA
MKSERLVMGLDVGSARTTAVIAEAVGGAPRRPGVRVLGVAQARTTGLRRGVVADIEEAARAVRRRRRGRAHGRRPRRGRVRGHRRRARARGDQPGDRRRRRRRDHACRRRPGERGGARARHPADRELLHAIPQEYTVDRAAGIQDPVGMGGMRLETDMYLVTIGSQPAANLRKCVERAGHQVRELVLEPLASALAVLTEDEKDLGVTLVELGASSTDVAVFHDNKIRHLANIPYGGAHVTNDLVHGVNLSQSDADHLKETYGVALERMVEGDEVIALPDTPAHAGGRCRASCSRTSSTSGLDEIFELVVRSVRGAGLGGQLAGGVVLTGGGAQLPGTAELARDVFGASVRVGRPLDAIVGLREALDTPREATVAGLTLYGASRLAIGGGGAPVPRRVALPAPGVDKWAQRVKLWLQDFF